MPNVRPSLLPLLTLLAPLAAAGCHDDPRFEASNGSTQVQLNAIARSTSEHDGQVVRNPSLTPDDVGQNMRMGATKSPQRR